jgi:hypothetical protein
MKISLELYHIISRNKLRDLKSCQRIGMKFIISWLSLPNTKQTGAYDVANPVPPSGQAHSPILHIITVRLMIEYR